MKMILDITIKISLIVISVFLPLTLLMLRRGWFPNILEEVSTEISVKFVDTAEKILSKMRRDVETARELRDYTKRLKGRVRK